MKGNPKISAASRRSSNSSMARKLPVGILLRWKNLRCSSLSCEGRPCQALTQLAENYTGDAVPGWSHVNDRSTSRPAFPGSSHPENSLVRSDHLLAVLIILRSWACAAAAFPSREAWT